MAASRSPLVLGLVVGAVIACGSSTKDDGSSSGACSQGDVVECHCSDGSLGEAICEDDGAIGVCDCGSTGGGGTSAGGSSSGGAGLGGSAGSSGLGGSSGASGGTSGTGPDPADCPTQLLPVQVVDADYSSSLDRLIVLGSAPNAVSIVDYTTLETVTVALPYAGSSLSVSPDGETAAVAHDGHVSIVDLAGGVLSDTIATTTVAGNIVMGGNGFAYLMPSTVEAVPLHSIDIAARMDLESDTFTIYGGTLAKLHPSGETLYAITGGNQSSLERYDISSGPASTKTQAPFVADYPFCGNLWMSKDGARIFTACGNVFRAAPGSADDMTYEGALEDFRNVAFGPRYRSIGHDDVHSRIHVILSSNTRSFEGPIEEEAGFTTFVYESLSYEQGRNGHCYQVGSTRYVMYGRYLFPTSDGSKVVVIVQAGQGEQLLDIWGVDVHVVF
jgi:WD40 repeat protein